MPNHVQATPMSSNVCSNFWKDRTGHCQKWSSLWKVKLIEIPDLFPYLDEKHPEKIPILGRGYYLRGRGQVNTSLNHTSAGQYLCSRHICQLQNSMQMGICLAAAMTIPLSTHSSKTLGLLMQSCCPNSNITSCFMHAQCDAEGSKYWFLNKIVDNQQKLR